MKSLIDGSTTYTPPANGPYNPTREQLIEMGYRFGDENTPPLDDDKVRISAEWVDDDGVNGRWEVVDRPKAEVQAELQAARMATFPAQEAVIFRLTMRRNFGDNAETNRDIDAKAVENHFVGKQVNGTITVQELADASVLERLFAELKAWNGTDETWSLFENYGGLLP